MSKPKIAFFSFTSCEGCQLQVLNCEDEMLDILGAVDIVEFREAIDDKAESYDISFIEGAISQKSQVEELEDIRKRSRYLVAFGGCATTGGPNAIKNFRGVEAAMAKVYGEAAKWYETTEVKQVDQVVKVDFRIFGCPPHKNEFLEVVKSLLAGRKPQIPDHPVCVECKLKENVCLYHKGQYCMGIVARAGCGAWCPSFGGRCYACRGLISDPNNNAAKSVLQEFGLTLQQVMSEFQLFNGLIDPAKK